MWGVLSDEKSGLYFSDLPGIASVAFLKSESHGTHDHILLSLFLKLSQPGGPGSSIYFPQGQGTNYNFQLSISIIGQLKK
jgi:hypothetical protein